MINIGAHSINEIFTTAILRINSQGLSQSRANIFAAKSIKFSLKMELLW
jgi:hypothetical protein